MSIQYRIGDVFERLAEIPDNSIDLIVSSPPFLALRSYLPDDHPDKGKEIGQEPTPAAFIDTHLALSAEYARVLAPHGTLCYEIGDTYSGSSQGEGSSKWRGYDGRGRRDTSRIDQANIGTTQATKGNGWPLAKSMCIIPHLFTASLAYGRNLLTGDTSPSGEWRIRNVICWARPNPPVGALGDKFRPATSYITVACKSAKRYFDLDAVRVPLTRPEFVKYEPITNRQGPGRAEDGAKRSNRGSIEAGAPPLDWHTDQHPEDGDWLWKLTTQPYAGSHFATFPMALPKKLIEAMCPRLVCDRCGPVYLNHDQTGSPIKDMPGMQADVPTCGLDSARGSEGNSQESFLFVDVLEQEQCQNAGHNEGLCDHCEGIPHPLQARTPDGNEVGVRDGTPPRHGRAREPKPDTERGSASLERRQVGQPDRESGTAREAVTRPPTEAGPRAPSVPVVLQPDSDTPQCPTCQGPTRVGRVLDPFGGSGTTAEAAQAVGRHAILIDLDSRNADLAQQRVGMFLEIDRGTLGDAA